MDLPISKQKRKQMEDLIYNFFSKIDPSGSNTRHYQKMFSSMNDTQFDNFFKKFFNDRSQYLTLDIVEYEHSVDMDYIDDAAKFLKVPLYEYVIQPDKFSENGETVTTKEKVPVGYIHMKPMQQMVHKKNATTINIDMRDPRTGQVAGDSRVAQFSAPENYGLMAIDAKKILKEFLSFRADDMVMKQEAYANIRKNGYVSMDELEDDVENKTALNTFDVYLIGMGIKSDLINEGYFLNKELRKNEG